MSDRSQSLWWQCGECGHTLEAAEPPETCPSCNRKCEFRNITCYTPECGLSGPDPKLQGGGK
jgi:rubredoxin